MTDHYVAYLQAEIREQRTQLAHLQGRLDAAHADRDNARDEAATLTIVLNAVYEAHPKCTPDTCQTLWAIDQVTP